MAFDIRRHVAILRSSAAIMVFIVVLAIGIGFGASYLAPRNYESRATLYVGQSLGDPNSGYNGLLASQVFAQTYGQLATTRPVLTAVIRDLGLSETPQALAARVSTELPADATLLSIIVRDSDRGRAADIANAVARQLQVFAPASEVPATDEQRRLLEAFDDVIAATQQRILELLRTSPRTPKQDDELGDAEGRLPILAAARSSVAASIPGGNPSSLTVVDPATASDSPVGLSRTLLMAVAAAVGLALALGFAYIRAAWRARPGRVDPRET